MQQNQTAPQNQTVGQFIPEPPARLNYTTDVVERMRLAIAREVDDVREAARIEMSKLQQRLMDADSRARRSIAELEQAMADILREAAPNLGAFPDEEDLANNPVKNLAAIEGLHDAQDAREGVNR